MNKAVLVDATRYAAPEAAHDFQGRFLVEALALSIKTSRQHAWRNSDSLQGVETLEFFKGSIYTQRIAIIWLSEKDDYERAYTAAKNFLDQRTGAPRSERADIRRFLWADESDPDIVVANYLRNGTKIKADWFVERNGIRCLADAEGFAVMADGHGTSRVARAAQVAALAMAYQGALYSIANDISRAAMNPEAQPERTMADVSCFMAAYYFGHPVLPSTRELREFYRLLSDKQNIADQFSESVSQVERLAHVVRERRRDEEVNDRHAYSMKLDSMRTDSEAADRKINRRFTWLSVLLTTAGLLLASLGALQVTPKSVAEFRSWFKVAEPISVGVDSKPPAGNESSLQQGKSVESKSKRKHSSPAR